MKIKSLTLMLICAFLKINAQFSTITLQPNYGNTNANIIGVGIGNWPIFGTTNSRFHINNFFCSQPNGPLNGLLFRTDGNNSVVNQWQLFTGATSAGSTEKYRVSVPAGLSNVFLSAVQANGNMQLQTGNITRLFIDNAISVTQGFVGIGANFTTPQNLLHIHDGSNSYLQVTNSTTSNTATDGAKFGLFGNTNNAIIASQELAGNLYFATAGSAFPQIKMTVLPNGNVGIGSGPAFILGGITEKLDVDQGDIDVNTSQRSYMIRDSAVLRHKGSSSNIYVGTGAGFNQPFNTSLENTYVGYRAGYTSTISDFENTYIGSEAGANTTTISSSTENVFVGLKTGQFFGGGYHATFVGNRAGINSTGINNSFYGFASGRELTGNNNCIFGLLAAGSNSITGSQNVFMGAFSGSRGVGDNNVAIGYSVATTQTLGTGNTYVGENAANGVLTGTNNTFIGSKADVTTANSTTVTNAAAIGANAKVTNPDHMILGDNNVNVGIGLSSDPFGPQKKLEINETAIATATTSNATIPGTFGGSSLRFTKLTSATPTSTNPGSGLLGVNATGDVIYVDAFASGGIFGTACTATTGIATLSNNRRLEMNGFNINFTAPTFSASQISLGYTACATNPARLNVKNDFYPTGAFITTSLSYANATDPNLRGARIESNNTSTAGGNNHAVGLVAAATASGVASEAVAGNFLSTGSASRFNYGIQCNVANATQTSYGARFNLRQSLSPTNIGCFIDMSVAAPSVATATNIGVFSLVQKTPAAVNVAGYFSAIGSGSNIGVYAEAPPGTSTVSPTGPHYAGYFNGDVIRTGADNFASDQNLKQNFDTIPDALGIINKLNPLIFEYKQSSFPSMNLPGGKHYGMKAQEIQTVLPELVHNATHPPQYDSTGTAITASFNYLTLEYQQLTPIAIRAIQQLSSQVKKLDSANTAMQSQLAALTSSVSSCCSSSSVRVTTPAELNQLNINLSDEDKIVLDQNNPNPFAEQTTITYIVPEKYGYAQIIFRTIEGKIIKTVDITKKGGGQLNVFANDLSSGMYSYSLEVDGKIFATKKMVKSE